MTKTKIDLNGALLKISLSLTEKLHRSFEQQFTFKIALSDIADKAVKSEFDEQELDRQQAIISINW